MATPAEAKAVNCEKVKCIALTFDDGPGPYTGKLLDTLKRHRSKVTFFLVGQEVKKRPGTARRMAREGHELGNHTYTHPHLSTLSDQSIISQIKKTQDIIGKTTGKRPKMVRAPYGDTNQRVEAVAQWAGLPVILWTDNTKDYEIRSKKAIIDATLGLAKRDAVVLMHDIVPGTVAAMPTILTQLKKRGFHVVTVSDVLGGKLPDAGERFPTRLPRIISDHHFR